MKAYELKYTVLLIFFFAIRICHSQSLTILAEDDQTPVLFAPVKITPLNKPEDEQQFLADTNGIVEVPPSLLHQPLRIMTSGMGYETIIDTTTLEFAKTYYLRSKKLQLNEVVVTGQYTQTGAEKAVQRIRVIDAKKIQSMAAQNLRDVLSNELNMRISQDNVLGSSLSLQGISGQNVKILVDGIPLTGRLNGNIDLSQVNMNNVAKIEIIEGPMSVNYGSDAIAGTINIITQKTQKETTTASSQLYYESNGQYNASARIGMKKSKNTFILTGARNYFDGWRMNDQPFHMERTSIADTNRYMDWKPKEQYLGTWTYMRILNGRKSNLQFTYTGDYFRETILNRGFPRQPYYETAFDDRYLTKRFINSIDLKGKLNKKHHLSVLASYTCYQRIKNTYYRDLTTLDQLLTENQQDQDTTHLKTFTTRGSISTSNHPVLNYEMGYDITHEKSKGIRIKNGVQQIGDYALFSSAEYKPVSQLIIRPGIRFMYNSAYQSPVIPSVHVRYEVNKKNTLRFSYARGFRSPSIKELYFYFVDVNHHITGNENLKAERSHHFHFSASSNRSVENIFIRAEFSAFYNYINKMIALAQVNDIQYRYFNVERFQTTGFQLNLESHYRQFKCTLAGAYIGRNNGLNTGAQSAFLFSPEAKGNLSYEWKKAGLTISCFYKYTGQLPVYRMNEQNMVYQTQVQDYHMGDVSLSKVFFKRKLILSTGVKNIAGVKTVNGNSGGDAHSVAANTVAIGMGRTYFIKLDLNFSSKQ